jgi:hypothetical protein
MKKHVPDLIQEIREQTPPATNSETLDEALDRIYERYGSDLPAFFRDASDAYKEAELKVQEAKDHKTEAYLM